MEKKFGNITIGAIKNVRKSGDEDDVYFADVLISEAEGFPLMPRFYCARQDDYAVTGQWVYQQIVDGNIEGSITQLEAGVDPQTGKPYPPAQQPTVRGAQTL